MADKSLASLVKQADRQLGLFDRPSPPPKPSPVYLPPPPPPISLSRPEITTRTLKTISMSRYNGGVKAKRQYGSATITKFDVWDERWPRVIVSVDVGGASAGERTTAAKQRALPLLETELRKKGLL